MVDRFRNTMGSRYTAWLQEQGVPLFTGGGYYWQLYSDALIPAYITPCFVTITDSEAMGLLRDSGARFLRYSTSPCEEETEWWYIVCDSYDLKELSSKVRNQIKRGHRECSVKMIDAEWLSEHGFPCYLAAHSRYKNATPSSEEVFRKNILGSVGGPFEYWGVFVGQELAGYCQCVVEENEVATSVIKFDPDYLKYYSSYALINRLTEHYVAGQGMRMSNGNRSISHDTNFQDFLIKLGFRKQYCRLNVIYQPWLKAVVQMVFPFRRIVASLPSFSLMHKLQSFLFQEELHRQCR